MSRPVAKKKAPAAAKTAKVKTEPTTKAKAPSSVDDLIRECEDLSLALEDYAQDETEEGRASYLEDALDYAYHLIQEIEELRDADDEEKLP